MRNTVLTALASALLTAALVLLLWPRQEVQAQHPAKGWEWKVAPAEVVYPAFAPGFVSSKELREKAATDGTSAMNKLAVDGWEFVGTEAVGHAFVFKRPRR